MKSVSGWVRQARHRAKKHQVYSDLALDDVSSICGTTCAYCGSGDADLLDNPFPLKDGAANVPANVLPVCRACKSIKSSHDVVWMFQNGHVTEVQYLHILRTLLSRRGHEHIRQHILMTTGHMV